MKYLIVLALFLALACAVSCSKPETITLTNWNLAQQAAGKDSFAAVLDRHNNDRLYIPLTAALSPVDRFTLAYWVYKNSETGEQYQFRCTGSDTSFILEEYDDGGRKFLYSLFQSNGSHRYQAFATPLVNLHQWYHVAEVADGAYLRLYIDGSPAGTPVSYDGTVLIPSSATFNVGSNGNPSAFFDGRICEVLFLKGDFLSATEVATLAGGKYYRCV